MPSAASIQIFTRRGDGSPRLVAHAAIGGYSSQQGDLGISGSQGGFDYAVVRRPRAKRVASRQFVPNDQFGNFNPDKDGYGAQLRPDCSSATRRRRVIASASP